MNTIYTSRLFLLGFSLFSIGCEALAGEQRILTEKELASDNVVVLGAVGIRLGTVFEVEGTLERSEEPLQASWLLFSVDKVNSVKLPNAVRFEYVVKGYAAKMPESLADIGARKKQQFGRAITQQEFDAEVRMFVGKRYRVLVVENGVFGGLPKRVPKNCEIWNGPLYGFSTYLVVIGTPEGTE